MKCQKCQKESNPYKLGTRSYSEGIFQMRKCPLCAYVFKAEFVGLTNAQKNLKLPSEEELLNIPQPLTHNNVRQEIDIIILYYSKCNNIITVSDEFKEYLYKRFKDIYTQIFLSNEKLAIHEIARYAIMALRIEVNSPNIEISNKKQNRESIPSSIRHEIFKRDNYRCVECGATNKEVRLHVDHIIPICGGGTDEMSNLQTLCSDCNLSKSNRNWVGDKHGKDK